MTEPTPEYPYRPPFRLRLLTGLAGHRCEKALHGLGVRACVCVRACERPKPLGERRRHAARSSSGGGDPKQVVSIVGGASSLSVDDRYALR